MGVIGRRTLDCLLIWLLASAAATPPIRGEDRTDRPNIILIMADDMGFSDIGCYGGEIDTPNLDRLAGRGLRFTQFYNTGRCCPTRALLMTGLWAHQTGMGAMTGDAGFPGYRGDLNRNCVTIAQVLHEAGYATFMSGKWHLTKHVGYWSGKPELTSKHNWPLQRGFDRFYGGVFGIGNHFDPVSLTRDNRPVRPDSPDYYFTDAISRETSRFILGQSSDRPFFCYVAYSAPHWALQAPEKDIAKYKGRYEAGWDAIRRQRHRRMIEMGIVDAKWELSARDPEVPPWSEAKHKPWQQRRMEVYAAMVDRMDQGIGLILSALETTDQLDNTLIFFLSDNGGCAEELEQRHAAVWFYPKRARDGRLVQIGNDPSIMPGGPDTYQSYGKPWGNAANSPFREYKMWVHEGGIATPLIVHWPARIRSRGELRHHPGHVVDIMATCVEAAGARYPSLYNGHSIIPMEGKSLLPAFDGVPTDRKTLYFEHMGNRAVRAGKWKLVAEKDRTWELYDLEADRTETRDLSDRFPERVGKLARMYRKWAARTNVFKE